MKNIKIYINECPEDMLAWGDPWDLVPLGIISQENLKRFIKEHVPFIKGYNKSGDVILSVELNDILLPEGTEYQYKFILNGDNPQFKTNGDIKTPEEIEAETKERNRLEEEKRARWREAELIEKEARERAKERFFEEKPYEKIGDEFIDFCKKYVAQKGNTKGLVKAAGKIFNSQNTSVEYGENNGGLNCIYLLYTDKEAEEEVEIPFL